MCDTDPNSHPRPAQPPLRAGVCTGASPWLCVTQRCLGQTLGVPEGFSINLHGTQLTLEKSRHPSDTPGPEGQSVTIGTVGCSGRGIWQQFPHLNCHSPGTPGTSRGREALPWESQPIAEVFCRDLQITATSPCCECSQNICMALRNPSCSL